MLFDVGKRQSHIEHVGTQDKGTDSGLSSGLGSNGIYLEVGTRDKLPLVRHISYSVALA